MHISESAEVCARMDA